MKYALLAVNGLLMIGMPLAVATFVARRYRAEWGLFGAGAATFIAAQMVHLPFNWFVESNYLPDAGPGMSLELVLVMLFYGLSAGVFEEGARYLTFRYWRRDARSWSEGLMVGAGHGGIEALLLGIIFIINTTVLLGMAQGYFVGLAPEGSLPELEVQASALLSLPWYRLVLGGVERALVIVVHIALSLMVLRAVVRRTVLWLLAAVGWHALLNMSALVVAALAGVAVAEIPVAIISVGSLWLIMHWREFGNEMQPVQRTREQQERPAIASGNSPEKLDDSRFV